MSARDESGHRWSGWPGAYCMYCGAEDIREICLADNHDENCTTCVQPLCSVPEPTKHLMDLKFNPPVKP